MIKLRTKHKNIPVGYFKLGIEEKNVVKEVLNIGRISEGKKVQEFEKIFADYIGTKYAVVLNSGTSALISGLNALIYHKNLRICRNQKIITTPLTYIATSNAIMLSGFKPVYVDIESNGFNIDPERIISHLKKAKDISKYAAILPVHLMGYACDMDAINSIAERYGLQVFEDSSQAHGTMYKDRKTGSLSLLSSFSFYIAHNIQVGEMGAVVTNDYEIVRLIRKIKANGRMCDCPICTRNISGCLQLKKNKGDNDSDPRFTHDMIGYNFKTTEFSAALGIFQLKKIDWINQKRQENVKYLNDRLKKFEDIVLLPAYSTNISYLAYPLVIKQTKILSRKFLRLKLEEYGIETRPLFGCIPTQQPAYENLKKQYKGKLMNAEFVGNNGFYIGCHQYLKKDDLDYIIYIFKNILRRI